MASEIKDGGSAYPRRVMKPYPGGGGYETSEGGMSVRDYFAKGAMQSIVTQCVAGSSVIGIPQIAEAAYKMADAMLLAREGNSHD